jgi:hypothetical protein
MNSTAVATETFSMKNAEHRQQLMERLADLGMHAFKAASDDREGVFVPIAGISIYRMFSIDAIHGAGDSPLTPACVIMLSGYRTDPDIREGDFIDCESTSFTVALTLDAAVEVFKSEWADRCATLSKYYAGEFDIDPNGEDEEEE